MSTYVNIELYDGWRDLDESISWHKEVILFYQCLYPVCLLGLKLERFLKQIKIALGEPVYYDWNSRRVAALLIKWAADESVLHLNATQHPTPFEPCLELHGASEYLWRIFLNRDAETYDIQCYHFRHANEALSGIRTINWRKKAQAEQLV